MCKKGKRLQLTSTQRKEIHHLDHLSLNKLKKESTIQKIKVKNGKAVEIVVIDKDTEAALRVLPTIHVVCETCGNTKSETWTVEAADENIHSTITFFRCTKCKTTRRESG